MTKPLTEEQKRRNKVISSHKRMTDEALAREIRVWGISDEKMTQIIRDVRYRIKDNKEWYDIYRWSVEKGETEVKSWASIYSQAYGYDYRTTYTLDTGYNKYETTLFDTEGWYTE